MKKSTLILTYIVLLFVIVKFVNANIEVIPNITSPIPTQNLQYLLNHHDTIYLNKEDTFLISQELQLYNRSNMLVEGNGAVIKMIDGTLTDKWYHGMLSFNSCENITFRNLILDANRDKRTTPPNAPTHTLKISGSENITLENISCINNTYDGFYICARNFPEIVDSLSLNVSLINCNADNSYRNGLTIIDAHDVKIIGGSYNNSNGIDPQAGIDLEPNVTNSSFSNIQNIEINGVEISGNHGSGILVSQKGYVKDITLVNNKIFSNHLSGFFIRSSETKIRFNEIYNCNLDNLQDHSAINIVRPDPEKEDGVIKNMYPRDFNIVKGNIIRNCYNGIFYHGYGGRLTDNYIENVDGYGIKVHGNSTFIEKVLVDENIIKNCNGFGIYAHNIDTAFIDYNYIYNVGDVSLKVVNKYTEIKNNTILKGDSIGIFITGSESIIDNNIIKDVRYNAIKLVPALGKDVKGELTNNYIGFVSNVNTAIILGNFKDIKAITNNLFNETTSKVLLLGQEE